VLLSQAKFVKLEPNRVLYREKKWCSKFYFIICGVVSLSTHNLDTYGQGQLGSFVGEDFLFLPPKSLKSFQFHDTCIGLDQAYLIEISIDAWQNIKYLLQASQYSH